MTPINDPILQTVWRHWEDLRAGRRAPHRSQIDPRQIDDALENTFILERVAPSQSRYRLAGLVLCDLLGMELRGMPADSMIQARDRERFQGVLSGIYAREQIVELVLAASHSTRPGMTGRMLLMPMLTDTGRLDRILGCMTVRGPQGVPPRRFRIAEVRTTRIVSTDAARPNATADGGSGDGMAEAAMPFEFESPSPERISHLRLVYRDGERCDED